MNNSNSATDVNKTKETFKESVPDELIIATLLSTGSIKATAASLGISEKTIYNRMKTYEFGEKYRWSKTEILHQTIFKLKQEVSTAIDVISDIMCDDTNSPSIRLQAAQAILNNDIKYSSRLSEEETSFSKNTFITAFKKL